MKTEIVFGAFTGLIVLIAILNPDAAKDIVNHAIDVAKDVYLYKLQPSNSED